MNRFAWTDELVLGHAALDAQHERMFALGRNLVYPLSDPNRHLPGAERLLALTDAVQEHFSFEEDLMRSAGYPGSTRHAGEHAALLSELAEYCARLHWDGDDVPEDVVTFLRDWLSQHIATSDREVVHWFDSERTAA
jgi:hemerythrin